MIPDEAVEAAAASLVESLRGDDMGWVDASDPKDVVIDIRDFNLPEAVRKLLQAAAPHMKAGAWDEGWEAGSSDEIDSYNGPCAVTTPNPYKP